MSVRSRNFYTRTIRCLSPLTLLPPPSAVMAFPAPRPAHRTATVRASSLGHTDEDALNQQPCHEHFFARAGRPTRVRYLYRLGPEAGARAARRGASTRAGAPKTPTAWVTVLTRRGRKQNTIFSTLPARQQYGHLRWQIVDDAS